MTSMNEPKPSLKVGPFLVDRSTEEVSRQGKRIDLTRTQFSVFLQLAEQKGGTVTRKKFEPWHRDVHTDVRHPVDNTIKELRALLGKGIILSAQGIGYRLNPSIPVTEIAGPSVSPAEKARVIGLDRMNVFTLQSLRASIRSYEEVLRHGPDADAYANLAMNHINSGHTGFCLDVPQHTIHRARQLLKKALADYPDFSSAYALRGLTKLIYEYDWKGARDDLNRAFDLNSDDEYAHVIGAHMDVALGRFDDGIAHARRAAKLDWRSPMTVLTLPWMLVLSGRIDEALLSCEEGLREFDPFAVGHIIHGYALEASGARQQAIVEYTKSLDIAVFPDAYASLAHCTGVGGNVEAAMSWLTKLREFKEIGFVSSYYEALVHLALGKREEALDALDRAYMEKCDWLIYLNVEPRWEPIRKNARFISLMQKVGLVVADSEY